MSVSFQETLKKGLIGEGIIARWFIYEHNCSIIPAYEVEINSGKGPRFFSEDGPIVSPDMLVIPSGNYPFWVEAKTKSAFTWYRIGKKFQTGLDRRHWLDYLRVREISEMQVWIIFLHKPGFLAKDTPDGLTSPCGLYGNSTDVLAERVDHESGRYGPSGMVYWNIDDLEKLAEFEEVDAYSIAT